MNSQAPALRSLGVVTTQHRQLELPDGVLRLESGGALREVHVAYETYGTLAPTGDNVVYICHALTMDAHAAGYQGAEGENPGWWHELVGPGRGIDTDRYFVVCANILGGCKGTTGPASTNPETGRPYGSSFPTVTVGDMVVVQRLLLEQLGVTRLHAVIGGSLGGMQVLEWAIRFPDFVERCVCIASAMSLSAQALAFDIVGREAIRADPGWHGGDYYERDDRPSAGLAQARMLGHITYLSPEIMKSKFGRERREDDKRFQVESYLQYQGRKFVGRFDANSYLHITQAMDAYDLVEAHGSIDAALKPVRARFLVVALSSDWLFPREQSLELSTALLQADKRVSYCELHAPYGHDAFLVDIDHLADVVQTFLGREGNEALVPTETATAAPFGEDFRCIRGFVRPDARVLDLGCGDGALLAMLAAERGAHTLGIDIDLQHVIQVLSRGQDVLQIDVDNNLALIPDQSYDYAILSQTLQVIRRPRDVLREMLRVARECIVSFPNFARWSYRWHLGVKGRMPKSKTLPYEWYETPNIHLATLKDFEDLCRHEGIRVLEQVCVPSGHIGRLLNACGLTNLGSDRVLVRITRA